MELFDSGQYEGIARLLRVLGHPMRLAMVEALRFRPWCVCELAAHMDLNKSTTSKHLSQLKDVGVIDMVREGTQVNCTLVMPCVFDMMHCANHSHPEGLVDSEIDQRNRCATNCCSPRKEKP